MDDRLRVLISACLGAVAGGLGGYLYLTEDGRRMRERLEPGMDELLREVRRMRSATEKARLAAQEGWGALEDLGRPVSSAGTSGWGVRPPRQR